MDFGVPNDILQVWSLWQILQKIEAKRKTTTCNFVIPNLSLGYKTYIIYKLFPVLSGIILSSVFIILLVLAMGLSSLCCSVSPPPYLCISQQGRCSAQTFSGSAALLPFSPSHVRHLLTHVKPDCTHRHDNSTETQWGWKTQTGRIVHQHKPDLYNVETVT